VHAGSHISTVFSCLLAMSVRFHSPAVSQTTALDCNQSICPRKFHLKHFYRIFSVDVCTRKSYRGVKISLFLSNERGTSLYTPYEDVRDNYIKSASGSTINSASHCRSCRCSCHCGSVITIREPIVESVEGQNGSVAERTLRLES
jgi:hypothetical protein